VSRLGCSPPSIVITLALEQSPRVHLVCANSSEEQRLREYIATQTDLRELVEVACQLERERAA